MFHITLMSLRSQIYHSNQTLPYYNGIIQCLFIHPTFNCTLSSLHKINIAIKPRILKMVIKPPLGFNQSLENEQMVYIYIYYIRANGFITPRKWSMRSNVKLLDHHPTILLQHTIELIPSWHACGRRLLSFQVHLQVKKAQWQTKFEANSSVQQ